MAEVLNTSRTRAFICSALAKSEFARVQFEKPEFEEGRGQGGGGGGLQVEGGGGITRQNISLLW